MEERVGDPVSFVVRGQPVPQPRHRTTRTGRHYLPTRHPIHAFKAAVGAEAAKRSWNQAAWYRVEILAVIARPASHLKASGDPRPSAPRFPGHRDGDWDNLAKAVCDAMTGIAWADDTQIVDGRCIKRYATAGEPPFTVVTVTEVA